MSQRLPESSGSGSGVTGPVLAPDPVAVHNPPGEGGMMMHSQQPDPLMPASHRFPRNAFIGDGSDALPSTVRPFVLRGASVGGDVPVGKHRTPATRRPNTQATTSDGKNPTVKADVYYTPDD